MRDLRIGLTVAIQEKRVDLLVDNLIISLTPYVIKELNGLVKYIAPFLKPGPRIRPGQGERIASHPKAR